MKLVERIVKDNVTFEIDEFYFNYYVYMIIEKDSEIQTIPCGRFESLEDAMNYIN